MVIPPECNMILSVGDMVEKEIASPRLEPAISSFLAYLRFYFLRILKLRCEPSV